MCNSYLGSYVRELERKLAEYQRWDEIIGAVERAAAELCTDSDFKVLIDADDYAKTQDDVPETESEQVKLIDQMYVALSDVESRYELSMSSDDWIFSDVRKVLVGNNKLIDNLLEHL